MPTLPRRVAMDEWDMGSQCNGGYARVGSKLSTLRVGRVSDGRVVNRQSTHTTSQGTSRRTALASCGVPSFYPPPPPPRMLLKVLSFEKKSKNFGPKNVVRKIDVFSKCRNFKFLKFRHFEKNRFCGQHLIEQIVLSQSCDFFGLVWM